jgi:hypothetical protein
VLRLRRIEAVTVRSEVHEVNARLDEHTRLRMLLKQVPQRVGSGAAVAEDQPTSSFNRFARRVLIGRAECRRLPSQLVERVTKIRRTRRRPSWSSVRDPLQTQPADRHGHPPVLA